MLLHEAEGMCGTLNERPLKGINHWSIVLGNQVLASGGTDGATMIDMDTILDRFRSAHRHGVRAVAMRCHLPAGPSSGSNP